jgi:hypothetical protein
MTGDLPKVEIQADKGFALVPVMRLEPAQESIRCVETDSGEVYFEFWVQGRQTSVRIHADSYLGVLAHLRENPVEDDLFEHPPTARVGGVRK